MNLILASQSPRRRELLQLAGFAFTAEAADADETLPDDVPLAEAVQTLAQRKAQAVFTRHPDCCVLGADTLVALEDTVLGKPADTQDAARMLRLLSGNTHTVYTGVCILSAGREIRFAEQTQVTFFSLTEREIAAYTASDEPLDKAGAYGIQGKGCTLVQGIRGDYYTVMGLPIGRTARELGKIL